jgi:hypothetical protein
MNVDELVKYISDKTNLTKEQAKEASSAAAGWLKGVLPDDVKVSLGEFFDSAGDLASKASDATGDAAKGIWDKTKDAASDMMAKDDDK